MLKKLWQKRSQFPIDKIGHCIFVGLLPTLLLGWGYGVYGSIGIEVVQAESQKDITTYLKKKWKDILGDLAADSLGVLIALFIRGEL